MKLFKVLLNSLLCGLFFSALLALLCADLNINKTVTLTFLGQLTIYLAAVYGLIVTILSLVLFFMIEFFAGRGAKIGLISASFLSLGFSLLILLFLAFFWANYTYFLSFFDSRHRFLIQSQMLALFFFALLGLTGYYFLRRYKKGLYYALYFVLFFGLLGLVFSQRWQFPQASTTPRFTPLIGREIDRKVIIIGLEGLSFSFLIPSISERKLPNFSWLLENGSWGNLRSFTPNEAITLNTSFNTGKYPAKHRRLSLFEFQVLKMKEKMEVVPRFILFNQLTRIDFLKTIPYEPVQKVKDIWQILEANQISKVRKDWPYDFVPSGPSPKTEKLLNDIFGIKMPSEDENFTRAARAFTRDCAYEEAASAEKEAVQPKVFYLFLDGLNTVMAYYYKYSFPDQFGGLDQEDIDRYGSIIEKYYNFYDQLIGKYITSLKEDELLVVFSPHGTEPLTVWKRFVERLLGDPSVSAHHESAPDGVVFFYGRGIRRGNNIEEIRIVDVAPNLLYFLGLPVGRDMDGIVRSSLFVNDFIAENPVIYISSYEDYQIIPRLK